MAPASVRPHLRVSLVQSAQRGTLGRIAKHLALAASMADANEGAVVCARKDGRARTARFQFVPEDCQGPCVSPTAQRAVGTVGALCWDPVCVMHPGQAQIAQSSCAVLA